LFGPYQVARFHHHCRSWTVGRSFAFRFFERPGPFFAAVGVVFAWGFQMNAWRLQGASPQRPTDSSSAASDRTSTASSPREVVTKYCISCHNQRLQTAGLALESLDFDNVPSAPNVWEKVVRKIRDGGMPPSGMPRPDRQTMDNFVAGIEKALDGAADAAPNPGRVALHRLNRAEYANVIRDLFDLEIDSESLLPADDADEHGFENIAGVLSVSPALLEGYVAAAERISRLVVGDRTIVPVFETHTLPKTSDQDDRMSEELPFGSRGGIAIHYHFPVDGQYVVKIGLRRELYGYIVGLGHPQKLEVRLDGQPIKVFTIGGETHGTPAPATWAGFVPGDPDWEKYMQDADHGVEFRFTAKAGSRKLGVSFVGETLEPEGVMHPRNSPFGLGSDELYDGNAAIDTVAVGGPFNVSGTGESASRRTIFVCYPAADASQDACAAKIVSTLARRAYRRAIKPSELESLMKFYRKGKADGGFEAGIQFGLYAMLTDPSFLLRVEDLPANAKPGAIYRLSDLDLATRLSFFLWSSLPDDELLDVATRGKLKDPAVLEQQVRRMFADRRAKALVTNFASQWLDLGKLRGLRPDEAQFPEFDDTLRDAFQQETELFLESQILEDRGVRELLDARYTFVNQRLAQYYGIPNVLGSRFAEFRSRAIGAQAFWAKPAFWRSLRIRTGRRRFFAGNGCWTIFLGRRRHLRPPTYRP
jgi:mono/diheme cytochrome c family protein